MANAFAISIKPPEAVIRRIEQQLGAIPGAGKKAMASGLNKTADHGRAQIRRVIQEELNVSTKAVLRVIKIRGATPERLDVKITVSREPIKLGEYKPKPGPAGAIVRVRKTRGPETIKGAFIATMPSGHMGVFVRSLKGVRRPVIEKNGKRYRTWLPIVEKYGPTVVGVLAGKPGLSDSISRDLDEFLVKSLESQLSRFLNPK